MVAVFINSFAKRQQANVNKKYSHFEPIQFDDLSFRHGMFVNEDSTC